ncbi:hypothetical protein RDABS01_034304 [Bienertia sinuspersici]
MANAKDPTTPSPAIGKIGPYTVFLTPQKPTSEEPTSKIPETPKKIAVNNIPPPVQPPPAKYEPVGDRFSFLWEAVSKVQNVHASVDEYMANWLGLNQSKYQWALDDYYESKGMEKGGALKKDVSSKSQAV